MYVKTDLFKKISFFVVNNQNHFSGLGLKKAKKGPKEGQKRAKKRPKKGPKTV